MIVFISGFFSWRFFLLICAQPEDKVNPSLCFDALEGYDEIREL